MLLEHLAAAAREARDPTFVAEVLPENAAMMRVFTDAGYVVDRHYDDGVVAPALRHRADEARSIEVASSREQRTEARSIARLLSPASVASWGCGRRPDNLGRIVLTNLRPSGFTGTAVPGQPRTSDVDGLRATRRSPRSRTRSTSRWSRTGAAVPAVVADCADKGVRGLVVISGGFAETGPAGARAERELVELARANGARVVGPNCLGIVNTAPEVQLNATLAPRLPGRGRVGFFCQSGALGIALLEQIDRRGIGLSTFVSAGNRADVSGNDLLQYWQDDPATDVVLMYLETFGNPRKFARLARRLARRKPVVVLGRSGRGRDGRAERAGAVRVLRRDQGGQPRPALRRRASSSRTSRCRPGAGWRSWRTRRRSACSSPTRAPPPAWRSSTAGQSTSGRTPARTSWRVRSAMPQPISGWTRSWSSSSRCCPRRTTAYADALVRSAARADLPVVTTFLAASGVPERLRRVAADGAASRGSVPSYPSPEDAARALGRVAEYAEWRRTPGRRAVAAAGHRRAGRPRGARPDACRRDGVRRGGVTHIDPVTLADAERGGAAAGVRDRRAGRYGTARPLTKRSPPPTSSGTRWR